MSRRDLQLEPLSRRASIALLFGPVVALLAGLLAVYLLQGAAAMGFLLGMASVSVLTGAGKFVVLAALTPSAPVGPFELALLVIAMDTAAALMLVPIMPLVYRAPVIGKYLNQVRLASREVLRRNRWMRRFTLAGLIGYVAVPFGGTGAVGAVFLGRLLGLGRAPIVAGTFFGAVLGAAMIYGVASLGMNYIDALRDNPFFTLGGLAVVLAAAGVVVWRLLRVMRSTGRAQDASWSGERSGPATSKPGLDVNKPGDDRDPAPTPVGTSGRGNGASKASGSGNGNGKGHNRKGHATRAQDATLRKTAPLDTVPPLTPPAVQ